MTTYKDVRLSVKGFSITDEGEENDVDLYTTAVMKVDGDSITLNYIEPATQHRNETECSIIINKTNMVVEKREAENHNRVYVHRYNEDVVASAEYVTPAGPIEVEIITHEYKNTLTPEGEGAVEVRFRIELKGLGAQERRFKLEVLPILEGDWDIA